MKRRFLIRRAAQLLAVAVAALAAKEAFPVAAEPARPVTPPVCAPVAIADNDGCNSQPIDGRDYGDDLYDFYTGKCRELARAGKFTQELKAESVFGGNS